ncbi:MAG: ECF-type sigma factor [Phycisphaerae bacterium]
MDGQRSQITSLLKAAGSGDAAAAERLWRVVYDELHRVARARMAQQGRREDLQTTVLVQEAYLRLVGHDGAGMPANRRHFFAAAANAMRCFLVDDARRRGRQKRGGGRQRAELEGPAAAFDIDPAATLAIDEAIEKLRAHDERKAEIVRLRYYCGLTIDETAEVLGVSPRQIDSEWRFAKAWLHRELS